MNQITRRNILKSGLLLSVTGTILASEASHSPAHAIDLQTVQSKQAIIESIRNEEIYLPTPEETLALTGSAEEASSAETALKSLSLADRKLNLKIKAEQDTLTKQYRAKYVESLINPKPHYATNSAMPTSNALQLRDAYGNWSDHYGNGVRNVLQPTLDAWRPNYSRGRVYAVDPLSNTYWWSVWRTTDSSWYAFPKKSAPTSGTYFWSAASKVERYDVRM